jgi:putative ABC transport system substrate-binding protein
MIGAKRIELLRQVAPKVSRVALVMNPSNPTASAEQADAEDGARKLGLETIALKAGNAQIVAFAERHTLPAVYFVRQFAVAGGLLSYGPSISWMYRQAGLYIGQILKGANPADMPVMQPTQFEFVLNLKTAKALGLSVLPTLLATADEVIE